VTVLSYTASRQRLNWFGYSSLIAAVPLGHFAISVGIWFMWWGATLQNPWLRRRFFEEVSRDLLFFAPALCLFVLSAAAYWLALKRHRAVWRLLLLIAVSAIAFFCTDVYFRRYQVSVDIATKEYWDSGGLAHHYFTWWWYNDLRFRLPGQRPIR
jgi:hypothetical protein